MTIGAWILVILVAIITAVIVAYFWIDSDDGAGKALALIIGLIVIIGAYCLGVWWCNNTASGIRSMTDQKAELNNGLERVVNIYTADGKLLARYSGKIDLEDNNGGYVIFDYEGKRYTYYNCFVESIAEID